MFRVKQIGMLFLIVGASVLLEEGAIGKPVLSKNTISLFSIHDTERNSNLSSQARKMPVGTIYLDGPVQLRVNLAMLKRPLNNRVSDWNTVPLQSLTLKDLTYAWGEASSKEGYSTFELTGKHSFDGKSGIYSIDIKCVNDKVSEYRIKRDNVFDTSWLKAK